MRINFGKGCHNVILTYANRRARLPKSKKSIKERAINFNFIGQVIMKNAYQFWRKYKMISKSLLSN